jgi:hypothetical protein
MIFGLLLASGQIFAQKGKIKRAYNFIEALDYQSAIDILLQLANDGDKPEVPTLLGQIYRKQNS